MENKISWVEAKLLGIVCLLGVNVPNSPGRWRRGSVWGLPRAPDRTGRLSVVRPGRPTGRKARVISHDVKGIRLVYDINLAVPEVQALGLSPLIVRPALTFPGVVRPSAPKKTDYEPWAVRSSPED